MDLTQINQKIEELLKDVNKRITNCALQKDFTFV